MIAYTDGSVIVAYEDDHQRITHANITQFNGNIQRINDKTIEQTSTFKLRVVGLIIKGKNAKAIKKI